MFVIFISSSFPTLLQTTLVIKLSMRSIMIGPLTHPQQSGAFYERYQRLQGFL